MRIRSSPSAGPLPDTAHASVANAGRSRILALTLLAATLVGLRLASADGVAGVSGSTGVTGGTGPPAADRGPVPGAIAAIPPGWWNQRRKHLDDRFNEIREDFWERRVRANVPLVDEPARLLLGLRAGGVRLDAAEVRLDPEKTATDAELGDRAVWVRHNVDIRPELNRAFVLAEHIRAGRREEELARATSIVPSVSQQFHVQLLRRHRVDHDYPENFWGYARADLRVAVRSLPLYVTLPFSSDRTARLLPGESITVEGFQRVNLFLGPRFNVVGTPINPRIQSGVYFAFGARYSQVNGHFRTELDMLRGDRLRVSLSALTSRGFGFTAAVGAQLRALFVGIGSDLFRITDETTQVREKLLELRVSLEDRHSEAREALKAAWNGDFAPVMLLAERGDAGVEQYAESDLSHRTRSRSRYLLTWNKETSYTEATEKTVFRLGGLPPGAPVEDRLLPSNHRAQVLALRRSFGTQDKRFKAMLLTDLDEGEPLRSRSFLVEHSFRDGRTSREELRELLRTALEVISDPARRAELEALLASVRPRNGRARALLYVDFDPRALERLLTLGEAELADPEDAALTRRARYFRAWAEVLKLEDPERWARMNDRERERAAREVPGLKARYENARRFADALARALRHPVVADQSQEFVQGLRKIRMDLYPIAAMARLAGREHLFAEFRIEIGKGAARREFTGSEAGSRYLAPRPSYLTGDAGLF